MALNKFIFILLLHYVFGAHEIEINYPKNGAPVMGPQVNVGITLAVDPKEVSQQASLCIGTLFLEDETTAVQMLDTINKLSEVRKPLTDSDACFEVKIENSIETYLESEITLQFNIEGWHFLRVTLEINNRIISSYITQVFVTIQSNTDNWTCEKDSKSSANTCVWLDKSMSSQSSKIWGIDWPIEDGVGWGTIGRNIVTETQKMGIITVPLRKVDAMNLAVEDRIGIHNNMRLSALLGLNHRSENHSIDLMSLSDTHSASEKEEEKSLQFKKVDDRYRNQKGDGNLCVVKLPFPIFHSLGRYGSENIISTSPIFDSLTSGMKTTTSSGVYQNCSSLSSPQNDGIYWGSYNVAILFSENSTMTFKDLATLRRFDVVLGGSTWNVNVLRRLGLSSSSVALFRQGIDPDLFGPDTHLQKNNDQSHQLMSTGFKYRSQSSEKNDDKFYIFSGGKLEYRKGQDLVVASFRRFLQVCPNAVLLVAWSNPWLETVKSITESSYTIGYPSSRLPFPNEPPVSGALDLIPWLMKHDIPSSHVIDLGVVSHAQMAQVMRMADVALFPNRCEGGTNLVAMEAAAIGLPLILSSGTGHADLVEFLKASAVNHLDGGKTAYIGLFQDSELSRADSVSSSQRVGWSEPRVDEIMEALAYFYHNDRGAAATAAVRSGALRMREEWSWKRAVEGLHRVVNSHSSTYI